MTRSIQPGLLTFRPLLAPLKSISPTSYVGLRQCALRGVWASARTSELLPSVPAARVGSVIHRLLEAAGSGTFLRGDASAVDRSWQELIAAVEERMRSSWLEEHLVPLSHSVPDFEVRRIQARSRALDLADAVARTSDRRATSGGGSLALQGCEVAVSTSDGRVRGRIDAIVIDSGGPVVRDYKSGVIFDIGAGKGHVLKEAYRIQLRMYAALYAETAGRWPVRLEVVPIRGTPEGVAFDPDSCNALVEAASALLETVNEAIRQESTAGHIQEMLARPQPETCAHCPFRPGCRPYRTARAAGGEGWPHDVWGRLTSIVTLGRGGAMIEVDSGDGVIRIRGLGQAGRHPALRILERGDAVAVFNARPTGSQAMFAESSHTVIYKLEQPSASTQVEGWSGP